MRSARIPICRNCEARKELEERLKQEYEAAWESGNFAPLSFDALLAKFKDIRDLHRKAFGERPIYVKRYISRWG